MYSYIYKYKYNFNISVPNHGNEGKSCSNIYYTKSI